jgi:gamma-glutamylcyclotransferase (GGCT)/AIG2-like uncharacterized protein YtfP
MWPEVLEGVIGRRLVGEGTGIAGYKRLRVVGEHYPVVVPSAGGTVEGVLYCGLTVGDFERLDAFEGEEYDRVEMALGNKVALIYVLAADWTHIAEPLPWIPEDLKQENLDALCSRPVERDCP